MKFELHEMGVLKGKVSFRAIHYEVGSIFADESFAYSYDSFNHLAIAEAEGACQVNRYDAEGLRHELEENGELVKFIFSGKEAVVEQDEDGNRIRYIRGLDLICSDSEKARNYYHYACDEMGSITHVVLQKESAEPQVLNRYEYDAFGNTVVCEENVHNRFRYTGQMDDSSLWNIARISDRPGPISISNVKIVGFKEEKVVAVLEKIIFKDISFGGKCNLFHYGIVQDCLQKKDFEFSKGNLYGIIGEFGEGGAALSCGITGNTDFYEGKIYIDGIEKTIKDIVDISWYIGNDLYQYRTNGFFGNKPKINKNTIKEQIEYGVRCKKTDTDFSTIQKMFDISSERVDRNIKFVGCERWKASAAIGYANGKKIFCYPWMNSKDITHFKEQLSHTVKLLLDAGCVVIMPTTKENNIKKISDKGCIMFL